MTQKKRILVAVGTRPEAVKMAPVVHALKAAPWADVRVLATARCSTRSTRSSASNRTATST
jgi:UDP-N-acetylglucosamine 2-epimerase